jgi:predicted 3-demethylubiquinone-9 3-methyltransferase (glyoxalase superfamily)
MARSDVVLEGLRFGAMDSARSHDFAFNEAVSFMVDCATQEEIDRYWYRLSAVSIAEQCGWLKDRFGVSWQIVPSALGEIMTSGDQDKIDRVTGVLADEEIRHRGSRPSPSTRPSTTTCGV